MANGHRLVTRRDAVRVVGLGVGAALLGAVAATGTGCSAENENTVVIYSCGEGDANELLLTAMHEDLPEYDIRLHYVSTGTCAARLQMEGTSSECDVVLMLEGGYLMEIADSLAVLDYDMSVFEPDLLDGSCTYLPWRRESACIAMNDVELAARGLAVPATYEELADPAYEGLICMPNPKTSGTGYNFLKSLVNAWGEDEAFAYFDRLAHNVYQFSSSGSGPVNALVTGEALIGLGLTYQAVSEINQGVPIAVHFFEEGSPWTMNGAAVVKGKEGKPGVRALMDWIYDKGILLDKQNFVPDRVFVDQDTEIPNFPMDANYADMTGIFDASEKERLLEKWKY